MIYLHIKSKISVNATILFTLLSTLFYPLITYAETLESTDYQIDGATINSGAEVTDSGSTNYLLHTSIGDFSGDPRLNSASYSIKTGTPNVFTANVPLVLCFETASSGSSQCTNGPSYLNSTGMITICGPSGCYDKARIEIDSQNNPEDTLYGIQISEDDFATDIRIIDWTTRAPVTFSSRTIDDYKTKAEWEDYNNSEGTGWTVGYNIQGLNPNTEYDIRIVALHGDFTHSSPSPVETATTSMPTLSLDLDISDGSGTSTETSYPYLVEMGLTAGFVTTANNLIWMDINSNGSQGITLAQRGVYGGLFSSGELINSSTANLDVASEGFGLQSFYINQSYASPTGELETISVETNYAGSSNFVGEIDTSLLDVYQSTGPIYSGRAALYVKAKPATTTPTGNYTETISFVLIAGY